MIRIISKAHRCPFPGRSDVLRKVMVFAVCCSTLLVSACSRQEQSEAEEAEWADIQPITNAAFGETAHQPSRRVVHSEGEDYFPLIQRLAEMESIGRAAGETMITGESLTLNYERRFVRMDGDVKVVDDRGELMTESLMGRFSSANEVEMIEARKGVRIVSEGRVATAENATYAFESGSIELAGNARISDGKNRLSGGRVRFWIKGSRKMVCEPDALLEIADTSQLQPGSVPQGGQNAKIRSDQMVYDEDKLLVEFVGNVEIRDPRVALDCGKARLHLKESNEIDWIEALNGVIIQTDERKALAGIASYYADEGRFVLNGEPKVMAGRNIMTGDRIAFWHETQRMVCEPNARVLLYPDEEMRAKFLMDLKD